MNYNSNILFQMRIIPCQHHSFSNCVKRRNNGDKRVGCKQKHKANHANMVDSREKMACSSKYWRQDRVISPQALDEILIKFYAELRKEKTAPNTNQTRFGWCKHPSTAIFAKRITQIVSSADGNSKSLKRLNSKAKVLRYQGQEKRPIKAQLYSRVD